MSTELTASRNTFQQGLRQVQQAVAMLPAEDSALPLDADDAKTNDIIPLDDEALPLLPAEAFPDPLGPMIAAVATATETPVELAAMIGLGTVAAACQKTFVVSPEPGYQEPLSLWTIAALESGNRKTAVHLKMTEPLRMRERELCEKGRPERDRIESKRKTLEAQIKGLRSRVGNSEDSEDIERLTKQIEQLEVEMPEVPVVPRLWCQDTTPEKLGMMMADNGERLALLSDEGGIFDIMAGRYSNGVPNLDLFLQAHAGAPVRVDRGARPPVMMHAPALTLALSPQPSVLRGLSEQSRFRDRGLIARMLFAMPASQLGYRTLVTQAVPDHVANSYRQALNHLLDVTPTTNDRGEAIPYVLHFCAEAHAEWKSFQRAVEVGMRPGERFEHLKDWAGKLPGAAARVTGLFHCLIHAHRQPWAEPIRLDTMLQALAVLGVLSHHARAVFHLLGADPALEGGRKVWRWIERKRLRQFTGRQCYQELRGSFPKMGDLTPALDLLVARGYLTPKDNDRPGPGRKPHEYIVHATLTKGWT